MNIPFKNHKLEGLKFNYRPDVDPYDGPIDDRFVIGNGMEFTVVKVFDNWNDVLGLLIAYVFVHETMNYTHLSFKEMGFPTVFASFKDL